MQTRTTPYCLFEMRCLSKNVKNQIVEKRMILLMEIQMMVVDKFRLEFLGSVDGIVARSICSIFYIVERNQDSFT